MQGKNDLLVLPSFKNIDEIINGLSMPVLLTKGKYSNLEFRFKNNSISLIHAGVDIKDFSDVWLSSYWGTRDLAYSVKLYLDHFKTAHTYVEKTTSKITDQIIFTLNNISTPNTFFIDKYDISDYIETIEDICEYPLILKDITGSGGRDSVFVKDRANLLEKSSTLPKDKKFLYQKYIKNEYDWGIIVANGKIVSAEKSYPNPGEFRNNSIIGATEMFVGIESIPEHIKEMAVNASKALGLSWSRADIVVDSNTDISYLMEVNRSPGITSGTSEVSGAQDFLEAYLKSNSREKTH